MRSACRDLRGGFWWGILLVNLVEGWRKGEFVPLCFWEVEHYVSLKLQLLGRILWVECFGWKVWGRREIFYGDRDRAGMQFPFRLTPIFIS
jgi:hypothetical protein